MEKIDKGNGTDYMEMIEQQAKPTEKYEMIIRQQTTPARFRVRRIKMWVLLHFRQYHGNGYRRGLDVYLMSA